MLRGVGVFDAVDGYCERGDAVSRVSDLVKGAIELNLRYTSTLLHLSKDYLKDANVVLTRGPQPSPAGKAEAGAMPESRPPLLIVGRAGETGNGAFAINNPRDHEMNVHLIVQGELDERVVKVDPAQLTLQPRETAIVRILAHIDENLPVDRDHVGSVVAPGLTNQGVPFIVRRLRDAVVGGDASAGPSPRKPRAGRSKS
jgi:hypothetical protein